jgi:hypothetical protein
MRTTTTVFSVLLISCYVNLSDKTPPEFPMDPARDLNNTPQASGPQSWYWSAPDLHRFKLTVGSGALVRNVQARISVDGRDYPMSETPVDLFHYDALNLCSAGYNYSFLVTYRTLGQSRNQRLPSDGSQKRVAVSKFGNVIWFTPPGAVHVVGDGTQSISFIHGTASTNQVIIVRNLSSEPFELHHIGLANAAGATDNAQFTVSPTLTVNSPRIKLACGEEARVAVTWNAPASPTSSAAGALAINGTLMNTNTGWNLLLFLKGEPHPG